MLAVLNISLIEEASETKVFIAFKVYVQILIATGIVLTVALLRNVKQKAKTLSVQGLKPRLPKTIKLITVTLGISYSLLMIIFAGLVLITDKQLSKMICGVFPWTLTPSQINEVLNSVLYLMITSRMRCYCFKISLQIPKFLLIS